MEQDAQPLRNRQITREMEMLKSPTAVFSTIENRYYIAKFLLKIDFLEEFKSTIKAELNAAEMVVRSNPHEPITRKDRERKPVLDVIVKTLE
jgi:hypothetical protein